MSHHSTPLWSNRDNKCTVFLLLQHTNSEIRKAGLIPSSDYLKKLCLWIIKLLFISCKTTFLSEGGPGRCRWARQDVATFSQTPCWGPPDFLAGRDLHLSGHLSPAGLPSYSWVTTQHREDEPESTQPWPLPLQNRLQNSPSALLSTPTLIQLIITLIRKEMQRAENKQRPQGSSNK